MGIFCRHTFGSPPFAQIFLSFVTPHCNDLSSLPFWFLKFYYTLFPLVADVIFCLWEFWWEHLKGLCTGALANYSNLVQQRGGTCFDLCLRVYIVLFLYSYIFSMVHCHPLTLAWNMRRLEVVSKRYANFNMLHQYQPAIVCLSVTHLAK